MTRILLLVTVALLMAAMVVLTAGPAFGAFNCNTNPQGLNCQSSGGFPGESGFGHHDRVTDESITVAGGFGRAGEGGRGFRCVMSLPGGTEECVGGGSF
jgi:hypothetical protein